MYVRAVSAVYTDALLIPDRDLKSPAASEEYELLKQKVQQISLGGITAMHLTRERGGS